LIKKIKEEMLSRFISQFKGLALHDKFYKAGALSFGLYMILGIIALIIFKQVGIQIVANAFVFIILSVFTIAVAIEYWYQLEKLYSKKWFKWVLGGIAVLIYKYSELHAEDFINEFTLNEPSYFPTGSSVLATIFLPYSWLVAVSSFLTLFIFINWFFIPIERTTKQRQLEGWKYIARFIGLSVILLWAQKSTELFEDQESYAYLFAKHIVISTEYFEKTHCLNVQENELSAYLDRGHVSIFTPSNQSFRTEECDLGITSYSNGR
jgi:hypothetical protein